MCCRLTVDNFEQAMPVFRHALDMTDWPYEEEDGVIRIWPNDPESLATVTRYHGHMLAVQLYPVIVGDGVGQHAPHALHVAQLHKLLVQVGSILGRNVIQRALCPGCTEPHGQDRRIFTPGKRPRSLCKQFAEIINGGLTNG